MTRLSLVAALLALGCGPSLEIPSSLGVYSAEEDLVEITKGAVARWKAATGFDLHYSETGSIVVRRGPLDGEYGRGSRHGWVTLNDEFTNEYAIKYVITHELGHVLSGSAEHSSTGLMVDHVGEDLDQCITIEDLETVCGDPRSIHCSLLTPEC